MDCSRIKDMLSKFYVAFIVVGLIAAATISSVLQLVDFDEAKYVIKDQSDEYFQNGPSDLIIGDKYDHTMVFMQVSDLHMSIKSDFSRKTDLIEFCTSIVDLIKPEVVLVSGDLTDSQTFGPMGSGQHELEWQMYSDAVRSTNVTRKTLWLDLRGNHDDFDVYNWTEPNNYYRKYSVRGPEHNSHYRYMIKHGQEEYSFIGVEACIQPGLKKPFNFIGVLHESDISALEKFKKDSSSSNMTIWFGHYPTSSLATPRHGLREIMNGPYLCGHYHMNQMYASQPSGFLEVEVADWKRKRKFRVAAIDHGLFSFADVTLHHWPIIIITNPKPTLYAMPRFEPVGRIWNSTHIRTLVWSNSPLVAVNIRIDNGDWSAMTRVGAGPLYVLPWKPSDFENGKHTIVVEAEDAEKGFRRVEHDFSFDGTRGQFPFRSRFTLRLGFETFNKYVFFLVIIFCVAPLVTLRLLDHIGKGRWLRLRPNKSIFTRTIAKFYILSCCNQLFVPAIAIPLYVTFGPWFVAPLVADRWGVCFIWGLYIEGALMPGAFTYVLATLMLIVVHSPMMVILAHIAHRRYEDLVAGVTVVDIKYSTFCAHGRHIGFTLLLAGHFAFSLLYMNGYGLWAWLFGFYNTWSMAVYLFMWKRATTMQVGHLVETARPRAVAVNDNRSDDSNLIAGDQ
ncbi:Transmembrane protein 62 [Halotydeus destructor]|nr:Transmembrane protein 62 [Halotydeus destructor]